MKVIDKIAWILIRDKSILLTKSYGKDKYYIPGGKREKLETDVQALTREIKEELSVDLKSETIKFLGIFEAQADGHPPGTIVKMTCYTGDYTGSLKASAEIELFRWLSYTDRDKISAVDKIIFDYLRKQGYLD